MAAEPDEVRALWQGWLAERDGTPTAARDLWTRAEPPARPWQEALTQGQTLREQRAAGRLQAADRQAWWQALPGPWQWREASQRVRGQAGTETYYSPRAGRPRPDLPRRHGPRGLPWSHP